MNLPEVIIPKGISGKILLTFLSFLIYTYLFYHGAWLSDDSFITFRVADNFLNGFGLRWNPLERVQVYTHPLWLFLLIPIQWIARDIDIAAYLLSFACGILFLFVYCFTFFRIRNGLGLILISIGVFFSSRIFIDYNTSGLENPLSFLLILIFQIRFYTLYTDWNRENTDSKGKNSETVVVDLNSTKTDSFAIGLLASLLVLTRLDLILFLIWPLVVLFYRVFKSQRIIFLVYSFLGILPWIAYLIFSLIYFGSFFPNTFYAKTNVLSSAAERMIAGWDYLRISLKWDPIAPIVFAVHLFWLVADPISNWITRFSSLNKRTWSPNLSRQERGILTIGFGGILTELFYLLWVGGDFMAGRFLGTCLIVSVFSQCFVWAYRSSLYNQNIQKICFTIAGLAWIYFLVHPASPSRYVFQRSPIRVERGIVDERASYQDNCSLKHWFRGITSESHPWAQYALRISSENCSKSANPSHDVLSGKKTLSENLRMIQTPSLGCGQVEVTTNVGLAGYYGGPPIHWIDLLGITDPFLSRLPGKGFPGHYVRLLPQGYKEYIEETTASLPNKELDRFYYEVRLLSEEEIWVQERWKTILDFTLLGAGNFKTRFPTGFQYPFALNAYRNTLYGIPFANWKDEDLTKELVLEYFGLPSKVKSKEP
ncbi:hypothetical protein [Leptospira alstonii]|uniref:Membrane protein n=2 Tax=Leptospira alstonii TaxID=28452 RepID=T0FW58_9LEPT|nr:hypothetical protein [Leptospira alstonii]EMJ91659.1 putative membrane protein [Leptospira alstonii serovar Sichuan str. 79601]EQA81855.1 putative membrane protein [Leptospira alstonii serovar Pingchang str. 80-412]